MLLSERQNMRPLMKVCSPIQAVFSASVAQPRPACTRLTVLQIRPKPIAGMMLQDGGGGVSATVLDESYGVIGDVRD